MYKKRTKKTTTESGRKKQKPSEGEPAKEGEETSAPTTKAATTKTTKKKKKTADKETTKEGEVATKEPATTPRTPRTRAAAAREAAAKQAHEEGAVGQAMQGSAVQVDQALGSKRFVASIYINQPLMYCEMHKQLTSYSLVGGWTWMNQCH